MDNLELSDWVQSQVSLLDPPAEWEPNVAIARGRIEGKRIAQSRFKRYVLAGAFVIALVCLFLPALPRVAAQPGAMFQWQRIEGWWNWFTLIKWNPPTVFLPRALPTGVKLTELQVLARVGAAQEVSGAAEASSRAGFVPRMPRALGGFSRISVVAPMSILETITTDLENPQQWPVEFKTSAAVIATWLETGEWSAVTLAQSDPPVVTGPAGFDAGEFTAAILRTYGVTLRGHRDPERTEDIAGEPARARFAGMPAVTAALMIGNGTGDPVAVSRVRLHSAPATMIVGPLSGMNGGAQPVTLLIRRLTVLWIAAGRFYVLTGELSEPISAGTNGDVANAMAHLIGLANSIE
jgi:hypothetical protein